MQPHLIISFDHYNEPDFMMRVEGISTSLDPNANFPAPWPAQVPAPAEPVRPAEAPLPAEASPA